MKISDQQLGYLIMGFVLLAIAWSTFEIFATTQHTMHQAIIEFDDVGSLQPQDPVMDRGMKVGQIASVEYKDSKARVTIDFDSPLILREGTIFRNTNFSLMGDRLIEMRMAEDGDKYAPGDVIPGIYEPGIAEALHLVEGVLKEVHLLHQTISLLHSGSTTDAPLANKVNGLLTATEGLITNMDQIATKYHPTLQKLLKKSTQLTHATMDMVGTTQEGLDSLYAQANKGLTKASAMTINADKLITALHDASVKYMDSDLYQKHMLTRDLANNLQDIQQSAQGILDFLGSDQGTLPDSTGGKSGLVGLKNINLFGQTAREKRRERESK